MPAMRKLTLVLTLGIVLAGACKRGEEKDAKAPDAQRPPAAATTAPPGTDLGATMPEYSAMWLDGSKFELASKRDKVVLLNVWATWCGPCRYEIPELQALHTKYASKGLEVIGVSVDESGVEAVKQFVEENKMTYPIALDPEGKLATLLQTSVLPTSVLIDRKGRILWKKYEVIPPNDEELIKVIEETL
jgi:cytochrome c biogenesis protein CcmG, thiol:disulfide interchange protein DsbE